MQKHVTKTRNDFEALDVTSDSDRDMNFEHAKGFGRIPLPTIHVLNQGSICNTDVDPTLVTILETNSNTS